MAGLPIWYELMTPEPRGVIAFYRAVVGWEIQPEAGAMPGGSEYRMIRRQDGGNAGGVLTLSPHMQASGAHAGWLPYFHVEDVDAALARVKELGGKAWTQPMKLDVGTIAMASDPQGAPFYLMAPIPPAGKAEARSDVFEPKKPGHCWWNELETSDAPAAVAFYKALFGWSADHSMPMGDKGEYRFVEQDGQALGAINPWMAEGMTVCWLPYFGVADIEAARDAARAAGGTLTHDVHQVPGNDYIFTATDPSGAHVGFVGPKGKRT